MTDTAPTGPRQDGAAVVGIDLGTSSVKVVIANLVGGLIAQADAAYPAHDFPSEMPAVVNGPGP
jgi:sugar (pentulose or hexulose) kinase